MNHDIPQIIPEILRNELKYAGKWISRAAMHGDAEAMALTKLTSFSLYYEAANVSESFYWVKRAAELKSPEAYYVIGLCRSEGYLLPKSDALASANYLLAASGGHVKAQFKIGVSYATGFGIPVNYPLAVKWYKRAAEQGDEDSKFAIDWCFAKINGVDQKQIADADLYSANARHGDAVAQNNLAGSYMLGLGVEPDFAEAAEWCRRAADQGLVESQNNYAVCLIHGHGVSQDCTEAFHWFIKSAKQGFSEAECNVGWCFNFGKGVAQDFKQAFEWFLRAAEQGHAVAQFSIANCYEEGEGVPKDLDKALMWYRKAAAQGNVNADKAIGCLIKYCENKSNNMKIDLELSIDGIAFPKAGQIIDQKTIGEAGLVKPSFLARLMLSKLKTTPSDEIYFKKNCFIQCHKFDSYERFGITANIEMGNGQTWGNSIAVVVGSDGFIKKIFFQVIMNEGIAEVNLQQFRRLCTKVFGTPRIASEEFHAWEDEETSVVSARNGKDAVFEWGLV